MRQVWAKRRLGLFLAMGLAAALGTGCGQAEKKSAQPAVMVPGDSAPVAEGKLGVQLEVKNPTAILGEPILLRTTVTNRSRTNGVERVAFVWWYTFEIEVAVGDEDKFHSLFHADSVSRLNPARPPVHFEYWEDPQGAEAILPAGDKVTRTDLLMFRKAKPGIYRMRAVLKDGGTGSVLFESNPVSVRLVPLVGSQDPIAAISDQATLLSMGESICNVHWNWFVSGEIREEFYPWTGKVVANAGASRLREPAMYARFASAWFVSAGSSVGDVTSGHPNDEQMQVAEQFIKEYPKSWLLPNLYALLFEAYTNRGKPDKAEEVRRVAIATFPDAAVLRPLRAARKL